MSLWWLATRLVQFFEAETAHRLTINFLRAGIFPRHPSDRYPSLATTLAGLTLPNPVGLAAGFDKNAEVPDALLAMGFGFVEVGAVTPRPQDGNPRPRVFRLRRHGAVINRFGFNNDGAEVIRARLTARLAKGGVLGVNLGANKDSADRAADFATGAAMFAPLSAFCTVNVSSPNTPGLRALQDVRVLRDLLVAARAAMPTPVPLFLKLAPDLTDEDRADLCALAIEGHADALILSNTTIMRPDGLGPRGAEAGGLSGRPLMAPSTALLKQFARVLRGRVPLIGVGGIAGPDDAYAKVLAGASAVQLYTGLVYRGPELVRHLLEGLAERLAVDGFADIKAAVGRDL